MIYGDDNITHLMGGSGGARSGGRDSDGGGGGGALSIQVGGNFVLEANATLVPEEPFVLKQPNSRILAEWKLSGEMQMEAEAQVVVEESLS